MIILGGEPPVIEKPEPGFGEVIVKLNEWADASQQRTNSFNGSVQRQIDELNGFIDAFVASVTGLSDEHVASKGAVHGETKATIGLSRKDNFRMATLAEQIAFANVNAFVTPQGAKQAIVQNNASFVPENYQLNDMFQIASFYNPDEFPVSPPSKVEATRYFVPNTRAPVLFNADRLVYQPAADTTKYARQSVFLSGPTKTAGKTKLSEIINLTGAYKGFGWNQMGCDSSIAGVTNFFRALADKKVYQFANTLNMPEGERNYLLYKAFGSATFKGLAINAAVSGTVLTLTHIFFYVEWIESNPTMQSMLGPTYLAQFDQIGKGVTTGSANGAHSYDVLDMLTVPAGTTLTLGTPSTALFWNAQDLEMYLHVAIQVTAKLNGVSKVFTLDFTESIVPGKLVTGGSSVFKQLGSRVKDVLQSDLTFKGTPSFFTPTDVFNFVDMTQWPGVVLNSGDVVKACTGKYTLRTKRYKSDWAGLKAFVAAKRGVVNVSYANTEVYAPARHTPLGSVPERLLPVSSSEGSVGFLSYSLDSSTGRYEWRELLWSSTTPVGAQSDNGKFGIRSPDRVAENKQVTNLIPQSLQVVANKAASGVSLGGLCFTTGNNFVGKASVSYESGVMSVGADVTMALASKTGLQTLQNRMLVRAKQLYPKVDERLRSPQIQVFAIDASRALVVLTDGIRYAEAGVTPYTLVDNVITLTNTQTSNLALSPVTAVDSNQALSGVQRSSKSGDDVWSKFSDILCLRTSADVYTFVLNRPFGEVYGDLSFSVTGFTGTPSFNALALNVARLYAGKQQFDLVEELFPAVLIPGKGVYQYDESSGAFATNVREIGGGSFFDPYEVNEAGWVRIPSGARVVLTGRTYMLDKDYPVKVGVSGVYYCYLVRTGDTVEAVAQTTKREIGNNEVMFGIARDGVLELNKEFLVMYNHQVSTTRQGSAIPSFMDDGAKGTNQFFTARDVK